MQMSRLRAPPLLPLTIRLLVTKRGRNEEGGFEMVGFATSHLSLLFLSVRQSSHASGKRTNVRASLSEWDALINGLYDNLKTQTLKQQFRFPSTI